jgi:hypothetical protein
MHHRKVNAWTKEAIRPTDRPEALAQILYEAAMTIDGGTAIILPYVLVSIGLIIASLLAARPIGWLIDRLRERRRGQRASQRREE